MSTVVTETRPTTLREGAFGNARALAYFTKYYNGQFTWDYTNYPVFLGERRPGFVDFLPFIIGGPGGEIGFATGDFLYRLIAGLF